MKKPNALRMGFDISLPEMMSYRESVLVRGIRIYRSELILNLDRFEGLVYKTSCENRIVEKSK